MKLRYETPEMEISLFATESVITVSGTGDSSDDNTATEEAMEVQNSDENAAISYNSLFR